MRSARTDKFEVPRHRQAYLTALVPAWRQALMPVGLRWFVEGDEFTSPSTIFNADEDDDFTFRVSDGAGGEDVWDVAVIDGVAYTECIAEQKK